MRLAAGWEGVQKGTMIHPPSALGYWISYAPDDTLLRGCQRQPTTRMVTSRGTFRKVSTVFSGYRKVTPHAMASIQAAWTGLQTSCSPRLCKDAGPLVCANIFRCYNITGRLGSKWHHARRWLLCRVSGVPISC